MSVVISPAHHLLAGGPEQDGVLELSGVAALGVAERRVGVHDAKVTQVLQRHQVLALAQAVQPAAAERQRAEVLVDDVEQVLRPGQPGEEIRCFRLRLCNTNVFKPGLDNVTTNIHLGLESHVKATPRRTHEVQVVSPVIMKALSSK